MRKRDGRDAERRGKDSGKGREGWVSSEKVNGVGNNEIRKRMESEPRK